MNFTDEDHVVSRHSIEETTNDSLRYEVYSKVFGRDLLVAKFVLREDAEAFVAFKDAEDAR